MDKKISKQERKLLLLVHSCSFLRTSPSCFPTLSCEIDSQLSASSGLTSERESPHPLMFHWAELGGGDSTLALVTWLDTRELINMGQSSLSIPHEGWHFILWLRDGIAKQTGPHLQPDAWTNHTPLYLSLLPRPLSLCLGLGLSVCLFVSVSLSLCFLFLDYIYIYIYMLYLYY